MIIKIVHLILELLMIMVFVHAIGSWIPSIRESRFYEVLDRIVEPMLRPIRQVVPSLGGVDISPMILIIILLLIDRIIAR